MLAKPKTTRHRIEQIPDQAILVFFKTVYSYCIRVGEGITKVYGSDKTTHPTGKRLKCWVETYKPMLDEFEAQTLKMINRLMETGITPTLEEIGNVWENVLVKEIELEKRKVVMKRRKAIPMNSKYEPFAKETYEYVSHRQNKPEGVFSFYRQQMYERPKIVFSGLEYIVMPYIAIERKDGKPATIEVNWQEKYKTKPIPEKRHKFGNHGCWNMRTTELRNRYGIKGRDLNVFVGWVSDRRETGGRTQDSYAEQSWREYLPKLLRTLN